MFTFNFCSVSVCGYKWAAQVYQDFDCVVSIGSPSEFPTAYLSDHPRLTRVLFNDVRHLPLSDIQISKKWVAPTVQDIISAVNAVRIDEKTLVHCHQGISRSTAIVMLRFLREGFSFDEIRFGVLDPRFDPNPLIMSIGRKAFGLQDI